MADPRENRTEDPHLEMMGDETEEQNLNQPGHPEKRIKKDEVEAAFGQKKPDADERRKPH
jgi:hypothetical protein